MTDAEYELCQDMISLMTKHQAIGFVGTFLMQSTSGFSTLRMVQPGYDETKFKELENLLVQDISAVFRVADSDREEGYIKPKC